MRSSIARATPTTSWERPLASDNDIRKMIRNYKGDLKAFEDAKNSLGARMRELEQDYPDHYDNFVRWPATQVVANGLILCISKCMGVIEDLEGNLRKRNAPVLKLTEYHAEGEDDDV